MRKLRDDLAVARRVDKVAEVETYIQMMESALKADAAKLSQILILLHEEHKRIARCMA